MDAATSVSFQPDTFQQAAGLVCYYITENWTGAFVGMHYQDTRGFDKQADFDYFMYKEL
ncbi:hypothetical protein [Neobacillus drentensis]|uniref:beta-xylosidase family glycoside hydrolase n=1 Tax=Neobacillus drentensis TaxID=220684 RepID=UPI003B5890F4